MNDEPNTPTVEAKTVADLERAKAKREFSDSIAEIKSIWPKELLLNGENPLSLLHGALSAGLHQLDEATATDLATNFRIVLAGIAERLHQLREDDAELATAIKRLAEIRSAPGA